MGGVPVPLVCRLRRQCDIGELLRDKRMLSGGMGEGSKRACSEKPNFLIADSLRIINSIWNDTSSAPFVSFWLTEASSIPKWSNG